MHGRSSADLIKIGKNKKYRVAGYIRETKPKTTRSEKRRKTIQHDVDPNIPPPPNMASTWSD